ncbi:potassium channel family protein [Kitasatospora sp. NBC_00240]|uniref:potassium channel family protein n=1 Tax=Kitasatospora sp. NBC_00240 TaxID=2903567 RepID=UPI00225B4DA5|nr:potassium channel family protein [Kitasatospora sp. NBC_00240]MCX5214995.1 potassium channel family protein [Kitasatospora sp. NBC_00240]
MGDGMVGPDLQDLPRRKRRRLLLRALLRPLLTTVGLVTAYYLIPMDKPYGAATVLGLVLGLLAVSALLVWQTRSVSRSPYPRLRAVEALAAVFPSLILLFATSYFLLERSQSGSFTESLSRTDAVYFTVTVFSTVGFGDIAPRTGVARTTVVFQMLADVLLIGVIAHVMLEAVRRGLDRRVRPGGPQPDAGLPSSDRPGDPADDDPGPSA